MQRTDTPKFLQYECSAQSEAVYNVLENKAILQRVFESTRSVCEVNAYTKSSQRSQN